MHRMFRLGLSIAISLALGACGAEEEEDDRILIKVSGKVTDLSSATGAGPAVPVTVAVIDALGAMSGDVQTLAATTSVADTGAFELLDVDVTDQSALILLTDDAPASGAYTFAAATSYDGYFPTVGGTAAYISFGGIAPDERVDMNTAAAYAVPGVLVQAWNLVLQAGFGITTELTTTGVIVGLVLDLQSGAPVPGATVSLATTAIDVIYPTIAGTLGDATDVTGLFVTADDDLAAPETLDFTAMQNYMLKATVGEKTCEGFAMRTDGVVYLAAVLCE